MLLAVDVGNTHVVLGLYAEERLKASWRLETDDKRTVDEFALQVLTLLSHASCSAKDIETMVISCVVPPLSRVFSKLSQKYFSVEPIVVGPGIKTGVVISVDDPRSVGSDRIVNAAAAKALYGLPAIVVDFGTATTFDVVSESGAYEGGVIAPGLLISAEALFERAAMLPSIEIKPPATLIGKNTRESMLSGIFYGYVSLVDGIVERLKQELGGSAVVIGTGGLARLIAEDSKHIEHVAPELTLEGLRLIASFNR